MNMIYFPSCKFTAYSPESSRKIKEYLQTNYDMKIAGCCRPGHKSVAKEDTVVYICNTCGAFCRESSAANQVISVWELLADDKNFIFPDYQHKKITLQDCWRSYDNLAQQQAIRKILSRMNIDVLEMEENHHNTKYCGVSTYEPLPKQNGELAPQRFIENAEGFFSSHTPEEQASRMKEHCAALQTDEVVGYCTTCIKGIDLGGKKGVHLLDLLFSVD